MILTILYRPFGWIAPNKFKLFGFSQCTWWRCFQTRVMHT